MKTCVNCGAELGDRDRFCGRCGAAQTAPSAAAKAETEGAVSGTPGRTEKQPARFSGLLEREDHTDAYRKEDIEGNTLFAVLSYLGILCLIPVFSGKESPYVRFHANQGLVLFLTTLVLNMARALLTGLWIFGKVDTYLVSPLFTALNVAVFALTVLGIMIFLKAVTTIVVLIALDHQTRPADTIRRRPRAPRLPGAPGPRGRRSPCRWQGSHR